MLKALKGEETAARFQTGTKKIKGEEKKVQESSRKGSPVKKQAGASRGGTLSKKDREIMSLAKDHVDKKPAEEAENK